MRKGFFLSPLLLRFLHHVELAGHVGQEVCVGGDAGRPFGVGTGDEEGGVLCGEVEVGAGVYLALVADVGGNQTARVSRVGVPTVQKMNAAEEYLVAVVYIGCVGEEVDIQLASLLVNAGDHATAGNVLIQTQTDELAQRVVEAADALESGHFGHIHIQRHVEGLEDIIQGHAIGQGCAVSGGAVGGDVVGFAALFVGVVEILADDALIQGLVAENMVNDIPYLAVVGGTVAQESHEVVGIGLILVNVVLKGLNIQ